MDGEVLGIMAVHQLRTLRKYFGKQVEGTTDAFWYHLHVTHIAQLYSLENVPSQITYGIRLLDCLG